MQAVVGEGAGFQDEIKSQAPLLVLNSSCSEVRENNNRLCHAPAMSAASQRPVAPVVNNPRDGTLACILKE